MPRSSDRGAACDEQRVVGGAGRVRREAHAELRAVPCCETTSVACTRASSCRRGRACRRREEHPRDGVAIDAHRERRSREPLAGQVSVPRSVNVFVVGSNFDNCCSRRRRRRASRRRSSRRCSLPPPPPLAQPLPLPFRRRPMRLRDRRDHRQRTEDSGENGDGSHRAATLSRGPNEPEVHLPGGAAGRPVDGATAAGGEAAVRGRRRTCRTRPRSQSRR